MKKTNKYILWGLLLSIAVLIGFCNTGCCSTKDSITVTTIERDTTIYPPAIIDSMTTFDSSDEYIRQWYNDELNRLYQENDSLRGFRPDTVRIRETIPQNLFDRLWVDSMVTYNGDSITISHKVVGKLSTFTYKVVPSVIKVKITDINTLKVEEKQLNWFQKIIRDAKTALIVIESFIILIGAIFFFVKHRPKL